MRNNIHEHWLSVRVSTRVDMATALGLVRVE